VIETISIVASINKLIPYPYNEEIVGTANALDTSIAELLLVNIYYELTMYL